VEHNENVEVQQIVRRLGALCMVPIGEVNHAYAAVRSMILPDAEANWAAGTSEKLEQVCDYYR
jgi:hypothetical protein